MGVIDWPILGTIVITAVVTAFVSGIVVFVIQKTIESRLNYSLEKLKKELASELQTNQIRLSTIYPKLIDVVYELQKRLLETTKCVHQIKTTWDSYDNDYENNYGNNSRIKNFTRLENKDITDQKLEIFHNYLNLFRDSLIYLPPEFHDIYVDHHNRLLDIELAIISTISITMSTDMGPVTDDFNIELIKTGFEDFYTKARAYGNRGITGFPESSSYLWQKLRGLIDNT